MHRDPDLHGLFFLMIYGRLPGRYSRSMRTLAVWGLTTSVSVLSLSPGSSSRQISTLTILAAAV